MASERTRRSFPHEHTCVPLSRLRAIKISVALCVFTLTACQHEIPTAPSSPAAEGAVVPNVSASEVVLPDQSDVVEELSARSRIPTSELQQLLDDCERTQLSMNICAFQSFVASDLELDAALKAKRESAPQQCRDGMDRAHAAWEAERDRACYEETEADEGGSMRPMLISACKTDATKARNLFLKEMDSCPGEG
nr:lysozyme inhibitor LprI family protein [uncultured Pseudoxanthomonas sp.]